MIRKLRSKMASRWREAYRHRPPTKKLSTKNLARLCRENATTERTLVVHSEDVAFERDFPNAFTVTKRRDMPADLHVGLYYEELNTIPDASYPVILCTGLLEHIPDPQRIVDEFYRILQPGGKLIISASAVFSYHECPNDFFHFTPYSFQLLFKRWARFEVLRGASQPFETIGILLQRILMQCEIAPPVRALVTRVARNMHRLDRFIVVQYNTVEHREPSAVIDSMLPSNVQAVVIK